MERICFLREVDEPELDELISGRMPTYGWQEGTPRRLAKIGPGGTGVIAVADDGRSEHARPSALVAREDELRRLFGRYAHLHDDLSPITAWCHVFTPRFVESLDSVTRLSGLNGMEAAWAGLVVAETSLILQKPVSSIRIASCLATQSYTLARTNGLWSHISIDETLERFNSLVRLLRLDRNSIGQTENRVSLVRSRLRPIFETLVALSQGKNSVRSSQIDLIIEALRRLRSARQEKDPNEALALQSLVLDYAPEANGLLSFDGLPPEMRLRLFDRLVTALKTEPDHGGARRNSLAMLAGYIATVAAGGAPSLTLAEQHSSAFPEILAWAYLIGGIDENVIWTSSFDGLGRLIARELLRPFRLDDPPVCDFSFEEATVLVDSGLKDPLVHLRVKQGRVLSVAIFPGVNLTIPLSELIPGPQQKAVQPARPNLSTSSTERDLAGVLADVIWPHIQQRILSLVQSQEDNQFATRDSESARRNPEKKRTGAQGNLPLNRPKRF